LLLLHQWWWPAACFISTFFVTANAYALLDVLQPAWYVRRQLAPTERLTQHTWRKLVCNNVRNFGLSLVVGWCIWASRVWLTGHNQPSTMRRLPQLVLCYFWTDLWFWSSHYWVHSTPQRHSFIHAQHHEFKTPCALSALYCSVPEMLIINLPLSILMPCIINCHPSVHALWLSMLSFYIVTIHSSHQLVPKWMIDVSYHLQHHHRSTSHYGAYYIECRVLPWLRPVRPGALSVDNEGC
jgi:hypothetical protein